MDKSIIYELVVNIKKGEAILANAVYHDHYIASRAMEITSYILGQYDRVKASSLPEKWEIDWKLLAIRFLEIAHAHLSDSAQKHAVQLWNDEEFHSESNGTIEFEEEGIQKNRKRCSPELDIDIENEMINFDLIFELDEDYQWDLATIDMPELDADELSEEEVDEILENWRDTLEVIECDFNEIPFDEWGDVYGLLSESCPEQFIYGDYVYGIFD